METDRTGHALRLLRKHTSVRDAAVVSVAGGGADGADELLAVVLPHDYCDGAELRDMLIDAVTLDPAPPVVVLVQDQASLTEGKADRDKLIGVAADSPYVYRWRAPTTDLERTVCAVVAEVLGRHRVSLSDNFVDLGGDSMAAIRVVGELDQRSGIALPVESLFDLESIGDVAALADRQARCAEPA